MNRFYTLLVFIVFTACATSSLSHSQKPAQWDVVSIPLPDSIADPEKQFSGLAVYNNILYLVPECRIQDNHETILYSIELDNISQYLRNASHKLNFKKHTITGLQQQAASMLTTGNKYEGLESVIVHGKTIYFGVETTTLSPDFFLFKGTIQDDVVVVDTSVLTAIAKPIDNDGRYIYNAGPEAMTLLNDRIYCFYEYNYFDTNYVYTFDTLLHAESKQLVSISRIPFRINDICITGKQDATAINFFYMGGGYDTVYRPSPEDANYALAHDSSGFRSYQRLINIHFEKDKITYEPIGELPLTYQAYNWEGITTFQGGYLLINDKYTPAKPYKTNLTWLHPK